jgi:hypothetical protein
MRIRDEHVEFEWHRGDRQTPQGFPGGRRARRSGAMTKAKIRRGSSRGRMLEGVTFAQVRRAALVFPGVEESTSYGTAALKVRGKLLARLHQSGECLVLRSHLIDREILMQSDPRVFFITDHYRD